MEGANRTAHVEVDPWTPPPWRCDLPIPARAPRDLNDIPPQIATMDDVSYPWITAYTAHMLDFVTSTGDCDGEDPT